MKSFDYFDKIVIVFLRYIFTKSQFDICLDLWEAPYYFT